MLRWHDTAQYIIDFPKYELQYRSFALDFEMFLSMYTPGFKPNMVAKVKLLLC